MKYILLIAAIILFSCSRDNTGLNTLTGEPEISFNADSKHYEHKGEETLANPGNGVWGVKLLGTPNLTSNFYILSGITDQANNIFLFISTLADTLKTIKYHITSGFGGSGMLADNQIMGLISNDDFLDITITNYKNGVVSGVFNGKHTKMISDTVFVPVTITNGVIKNVKIRY